MGPSRLALAVLTLLPVLTTTFALEIEYECEDIIGAHEQDDGECVCDNPDQIIDSSKSQCISVAFEGYDAACNDSLQCATRMEAGGVCYNNKCRCTEGYHYLHGVCRKSKKFGEKCRSSEECYNYYESDAYECVSGECACAQGAYTFRDRDGFILCRRSAKETEECETTLDCNDPDLVCDNPGGKNDFTCVYTGASTDATTTATTTDATTTATTTDATTTDATTTNPTTATPPCSAEGDYLTEDGVCICDYGYFRPNSSFRCVPELGEPCSLANDRPEGHPVIESASCRRSAKSDGNNTDQGVWACLGGFLADLNNRRCYKTREFAMNCPEGHVQCAYYGGECVSGSCKCPSGFHYVKEKTVCWPSKGLNEECTEQADCGVTTSDGIHCVFNEINGTREDVGHCTCKSGYHPASGDCRLDANALGETCTDAADCIFANNAPWIACTGKRCACAAGYYSNGTTFCETGVGGTCQTDLDCAKVEKTSCSGATNKKCQCLEGFVKKSNYKGCVPVATQYGQECEEDEQCTALTPNQALIYCNDFCSCYPNYHFKNNYCWKTVQLDNRCDFHSECIANNSICLNGFCSCDYDFKPNGISCVPSGSAPFGHTSPLLALLLVLLAHISR